MAMEEETTKQRIIERLETLSPDDLRALLNYAQFLSLDPVSRSMLSAPFEDEPLSERARELIREAIDQPKPSISDDELRRELGL